MVGLKPRLLEEPPPRISFRTGPYVLAGALIIFAMFGALGTWSALTPLSGAVIAPGVVTVYSKRKTIQHLEGGIVAQILVRDGDHVDHGQLLIRLADTRARANLAVLNSRLDVLRARDARLKAERNRRFRIEFPEILLARREEPGITQILGSEAELFSARQNALEGEIKILEQRIAQLDQQILGLGAQQQANEAQISLIEEELRGLRELYEKGYVSKTRILELERRQQELKGERGRSIAEMARAREGVGEAELQIIQVRNRFREDVATELHEVQSDMLDLQERYVAAADELQRLEVRAPQSGIVVGLDVHTVGAVISPGQPILDIVPHEDELIIEAQVAPRDIDKVSIGLEAVVRLSAFDLRSTPELLGTVFATSADRLIEDASREPYYLVGARIPDSELQKLRDFELVPGMPAEVFITTGERTALSYLIKPLADGLARAFRDD
jgi:HlyD family type I secretion membrane fusion protein